MVQGMEAKLAPSMMCADIFKLEKTIAVFEEKGVEYLHIDIMDGHFVPNYMLGTDYCRRLKARTSIPLDIHLMVERPEEKIGWFPIGEGDLVSVHCESTPHLQLALAKIRAAGGKAMAAINPGTPLNVLDYVLPDLDGVLLMTVNPGFAGQKYVPATIQKITDLRRYLDGHGCEHVMIEVDGNVNYPNAPMMRRAGGDIFVVGTSSIFNPAEDLATGVDKMYGLIRQPIAL